MILTDKKIACAAIRGGIKTQLGTLLECEIECCTGDNCNEGNNMKISSFVIYAICTSLIMRLICPLNGYFEVT